MAGLEIKSLSGAISTLDGQSLQSLKAGLRGQVLLPSDDRYNEVRQIWNAMIDRRPAMIVRCAGAADVRSAVRFAKQHGLLCCVRGAGHNIAGKALADGALLIDLSAMRSVRVDPELRIAYVEPGATLGDVDHETQAHGLAVPLGINSTTGISGLTLGGGLGWTSRKFGLTVDNLIAAEVVNAAGDRVRCSEQAEAELFWAIRGGGGNFGIVTAFEFRLHPLGPEVMSGPLVFPFEDAATLLRGYRDLAKQCPDELSVWAVMRGAPPLPFLAPEVHGKMVLILAALYAGPTAKAEAAFAPFRKLGQPIADAFGPHPFAGFQKAFDPLLTPGARNYWKSHNFAELSDALIDKAVEYAAKLPSPQSEIFFAQVGGEINRIPAMATAYPHRDAEFVMNVHTRWEAREQDQGCVAWARDFYEATQPFANGGVYINFLSEGEEDRIEGAYGQNHERLVKAKRRYDPDNFFRLNQNIRP